MQQLQALLDMYTYSTSISVPTKTLKVYKIDHYNDPRKLTKPPIFHVLILLLELTYHKTGTSSLCMKRLVRDP